MKQPLDYTISESLGQGQQISDDDLFTYVCGSTRHWNRFKRMWIAFVLSRKPWKGEVARMRSDAARVDEIEARDPNFFALPGLEEGVAIQPIDNSHATSLGRADDRSRVKVQWRLAYVAISAVAVITIGVIFVNNLRSPSPPDIEAIASAERALAIFSVEGRSEPIRHVDMSPKRTSVDSTQPTLRWSALDAKVRVIEVVLSKDDLRIASTTDVRARSWTVSQKLLNQSRYTWTLRYEVDQEILEADATFYVPSQEAISFASGLNAGLSDTKRASLLIELDRLPEAIRILDKVLDDQSGDVKVLEAARQLRQDTEAALRQRRG
ncbi:MAG: hypothetical protein KF884_03410 [Fimbriimonadaceae bacterium]|nr:hypothetical protein [Fimbriimonadaceae bacterium]QYK59139.1 MAG: hypothetical protein KF884_03410 [Fimbriimonadaceae bacterium]